MQKPLAKQEAEAYYLFAALQHKPGTRRFGYGARAKDNPMSSATAPMTTDPFSFDRTVAGLKQGIAAATTSQAQVSEKTIKATTDYTLFNQGTMEAVAQASQILAVGSQDLFRQMAESNQSAFAEALSGFRAIAAARTLNERLELQASLARTSAHWAVSECSRFAQAGIELAEKASAPLTARAALAAETLTTRKA